MKFLKTIASLGSFLFASIGSAQQNDLNSMSKSIYDYTISSLDGKPINLADYKGKKMLFVNVASKCGFTPQYADLQELHETYGDDLVIIGFPCNQFGGQEPGNSSDIKSFCQKNYGVTFLITEKIDVKGDNQHPIYKWLTSKELNGVDNTTVRWNFEKFLIDENGKWVDNYVSTTKPMSNSITKHLSSK